MAHYEIWETAALATNNKLLCPVRLPEMVHINDPALDVMLDFSTCQAFTIKPEQLIDDAAAEMKIRGVHMLLVTTDAQQVIGLISSEDILGEKPVKLSQERRLARHKIMVKMVMVPQTKILTFDLDTLQHAKVGHIINTMKKHQQHYALVIKNNEHGVTHIIKGLFSISQISKQLHVDITSPLINAEFVLEQQKR